MTYIFICLITLFMHIVYESEIFVDDAVPFERLQRDGISWITVLCFIPGINVLMLMASITLVGIDIFRKFNK